LPSTFTKTDLNWSTVLPILNSAQKSILPFRWWIIIYRSWKSLATLHRPMALFSAVFLSTKLAI
jgi:hypothetical protein